jgi:hypothetical protein
MAALMVLMNLSSGTEREPMVRGLSTKGDGFELPVPGHGELCQTSITIVLVADGRIRPWGPAGLTGPVPMVPASP